MGHKVHPMGFRIGVIRDWQAKWYADKHYSELLHEDLRLRQAIQSQYREAGISQVEINRQAKEIFITIYTSRPGVVIGRGGQRVDEMRTRLEELTGKKVRLNILEIRQPELDAALVARAVADQIERRIAYRRAMKQTMFRTIGAGAKGVRISCAGRLGGAEIARRQTMHDGQVPLHTLRADIDYGFTEARTTLGRIGVKVWIYKGDILPEPKMVEAEEIPAELVIGEGEEAESPATTGVAGVPVEPTADKTAEVVAEPTADKTAEVVAEPTADKTAEVVAEPTADKTAEVVAEPTADKTAEVVAEPTADKTAEVVAEPTADKTAETAPAVEPEEKPTKPRARRAKAAAATEPVADTVESSVDTVAEVESSSIEKEEKDATTEAGEVSQDS